MKKITIIVVDRTRSPFLKEGELFYLNRIRRYVEVETLEVKPAKITKGKTKKDVLTQEGDALLKMIRPADYVFALDRSGKQSSSEQFAENIGRLFEKADSIVFVVGGPLGLSDKVLKHANEIISLSTLTFTHEMSRLILLEQAYRALTILRGEKYHK
jgi:23S rRNA (pseudouridine1915-N3)-methyltransferase